MTLPYTDLGRDELLDEAARRARRYVEDVAHREPAPGAEALAGLARFDEPLPDLPSDPRLTLELLDDAGSPATVASTGSRYFGFVTGGTLPVALATAWMVAAWDQNAALPVMSPVAARLHAITRAWLVELLGLPVGAEASFVTGATMANATALAAARDRQLEAAGWDVQRRGLAGSPQLTVIVGELVHSTLVKAAGLLGLGRDALVRVPVDGSGRMRADQLPDVRGPVIVCAQAGEVNTGSFDPFPEIVSWARERDAWVHVDGAFGLWALADPSRAALVRGLVDADSWATDGHKWLNVTYDCGIAFVRRGEDLRRSFASVVGYLPPEEEHEAMHHTPQSSQRARQIEVWSVLRSLGRAGIAELVARTCRLAHQLAGGLSRGGLEVLNDVVLNQVLVRGLDDPSTERLIAAVQADGTCWCGPTTWQGAKAMRISVSGWNTTTDDVEEALSAILSCASSVGALATSP